MLRMLKAIDYNNGGSFEVEFENNRMYFVRPHARRHTFALNTKATLLFIMNTSSPFSSLFFFNGKLLSVSNVENVQICHKNENTPAFAHACMSVCVCVRGTWVIFT